MPQSDVIKATPEQLAALADRIKAESNYMSSKLADVNADFNALQAAWIGAASEEYEARQTQWNTAGDDLQILLTSIGTAVLTSSQKLAAGEKANQQRFAM